MGKEKSATFAAMVRASLGDGLIDGVQSTREGGRFTLPLSRLAVISAGERRPVQGADTRRH